MESKKDFNESRKVNNESRKASSEDRKDADVNKNLQSENNTGSEQAIKDIAGKQEASSVNKPESSQKKELMEPETRAIGEKMGIKWDRFNSDQFRKGMNVEMEHGRIASETNVTNDDLMMTGKIAYAHLKEFPDYYDRLSKMEKEAAEFWTKA